MNNYRNTFLFGLSLVLMLAFITVTGCQEESTERTLMVGNTTLQYDASRVQPEMAAKLGRYLLPGLDQQMETVVRLDYSDGIWQFQSLPESQFLNNPDFSFAASMAATELALIVFDGAETETHLCDGSLTRCEVVKAKDYMAKFDAIVAYNSELVDSAQVEKLLAMLVDDDFDNETATIEDSRMYYLGYEDNKWQFWMLVFENSWGDPYFEHSASYLASTLSHEMFEGEEVEVLFSTEWFGGKKIKPGLPQLKSNFLNQNISLFYNSDIISEPEAAEFTSYLIDEGLGTTELFFVSLDRKADIWAAQMVVPQSLLEAPDVHIIAQDVVNDISTFYFSGEKVILEFCDDVFWPVVTAESAN